MTSAARDSRSPTPLCPASPPFDGTTFSREIIVSFYRDRLAKCFDLWKAKGIDIDAYTTLESAHDMEDLRRALGAKKLNLWGISYGSHLGLTFMKYHGGSVNSAVLSGIEGLDQTIKRPALTDEMFRRVQKVIDADPAAKAVYPDLAGMMRRVHAKLNATAGDGVVHAAGRIGAGERDVRRIRGADAGVAIDRRSAGHCAPAPALSRARQRHV